MQRFSSYISMFFLDNWYSTSIVIPCWMVFKKVNILFIISKISWLWRSYRNNLWDIFRRRKTISTYHFFILVNLPKNNVLITLLTCLLWSLSEWYFVSFWMCGITHIIHPVTAKLVLMCNCLVCHILHTEKLRLSNVSKSILSGSSVPIFYSPSVSLSDEIHTFWCDEPDTGNSYLLSMSDYYLTVDIFVVIA